MSGGTSVLEGSRVTPRPGRRVGYLVAIAVNVAILWIANHLLEWEWPRFLAPDFDEVLPILSASIVASIVVNALWLLHDQPWFKALGDIVTSAFGLAVCVRTLQVFPFDFLTYARDWSWLVRLVVWVGIVGSAIGVLVGVAKLASSATTRSTPATG
jgi:hypothetical protein